MTYSNPIYQVLGLAWLSIVMWASVSSSFAQTDTSAPVFDKPDFSVRELERRGAAVESMTALSDDQKTAVKDSYNTAIQSLAIADRNLEAATKYAKSTQDFPKTLVTLNSELKNLRERPAQERDEDIGMTDALLLEFQQNLISKESDLRALRAEITRYETELQNLVTRPVKAREQLTMAQDQIVTLAEERVGISENSDTPINLARRATLEARIYARQTEVASLEQEITSLSTRQQIVTLRRDIAQIKAQIAEADVIYLQTQTGQRRVMEADNLRQESLLAFTGLQTAHPLVQSYAKENLDLTDTLKEAALIASGYPKDEAATRRELTEVEAGLSTAQELIDLGNLNRQSSATLRRLRSKTLSVKEVKSEFKKTQSAVNSAIQGRLLLEDRLRNFPIGPLDVDAAFATWVLGNPDSQALSDSDVAALISLNDRRRLLLSELSEAASNWAANLAALQTLQSDLVNQTTLLTDTLDRNLLWLPSIDPISLSWPSKALRGFGKIFAAGNIEAISTVLFEEDNQQGFLLIVFVIIIGAITLLRGRLLTDIQQCANFIGRVQKDSYWHTPAVILACIVRALPVPLIFLFLFLITISSREVNPIVESISDVCLYLMFFTFFFKCWREWNRDGSLFDAHFGLPHRIRTSIHDELRWFEPIAAVTIALIVIAQDSRDLDIYEGVGLLGFLATTILLSLFSFRTLWRHKRAISQYLTDNNFVGRNKELVFGVLIGLPILGGSLAAFGYFDTANELLHRLFYSAQLIVITAVIYGTARRFLAIAQRRVALQQAVERREKLVQARKDKEFAIERGETGPPPQIDYEQIDLETISRQTSELLFTLMIISFGVVMWMVWRDLLPALSIFDDIKIGEYSELAGDGTGLEAFNVTLWDLMQAGIILLFTVIAGKNLPGFLEIFLLNRTKLASGTKYAIKTVLGYIIVVIGILMAFNQLGTQWSQLQWIVAALGVGIGFGLQEIIANFISGLIILLERPVRVGDYVSIGDQAGTVSRIQIRATTLSDLDNREILIPNKELITGRVTNWTLSNSVTRLVVPVGIAYGSDTDAARDIIMDVIKNNAHVLPTPAPQVFFSSFGDSSLNFELRVFLKNFDDRWPVQHELHTEVNKALAAAGISIPFPQRDLNIVSQDIPLQILTQTEKKKAASKTTQKPS